MVQYGGVFMDEQVLKHFREIDSHLKRIYHLSDYDPQLRRFFVSLRSHLESIKEENSLNVFWSPKDPPGSSIP